MAKPDLGTKRLCGSCGSKFYDLGKSPIVCPKCETVFIVPTTRPRPEPAAARAAAAPAPVAEAVVPEAPDVELVSLEDADAEAQGKKPAVAKTGAEGETDEDVEMDESLDDAAFIEEEEDGDPDVTDIIGETIEKEEET